ncbi:MAG: hypothetical protein JW734_02150, partial [Candidatus Omnitrophica bacterium]|nr:hypothetical protein [Candidatus Omnitrophota bacterium]
MTNKAFSIDKKDLINLGFIGFAFIIFFGPFFLTKSIYFSGPDLEWVGPVSRFPPLHEPFTHWFFKLLYFFFAHNPLGYY